MAFGYNRITVGGNLTRDPEIRYVSSGAAVVKFTVAVNHKTKNGDETTFVDCVAWEKTAETINQYFTKGKPILVDGRLSIRPYETKEGEKRKATEVVVTAFHFIPDGTRREQNAEGSGQGRPSTSSGGDYQEELDDEIPF